jgi:hypothetical protein
MHVHHVADHPAHRRAAVCVARGHALDDRGRKVEIGQLGEAAVKHLPAQRGVAATHNQDPVGRRDVLAQQRFNPTKPVHARLDAVIGSEGPN